MKTRQFDSLVNVFQVYLQEAPAHLMMVIIANLLEISTGGLFLSLKLERRVTFYAIPFEVDEELKNHKFG